MHSTYLSPFVQHTIALATLLTATPRSRPPASHSYTQTRPHRPATTCSLHLNLAYCTHRHNQPRHLDCSMHICTCHMAHLSHRMSLPVAPHFLACCTASKPVAKQILTCCTAYSHLTPHTSITYTRRTVFLHLSHPHPACTSYFSTNIPFSHRPYVQRTRLDLLSASLDSSLVPTARAPLHSPTVSRPHMKHASLMVPHHLDLISASSYSSQSGPDCMCPPFAPALHHSIKATHGTRKPAILIAVCCPAYSTTFPIPAYSLQLNSSAAL